MKNSNSFFSIKNNTGSSQATSTGDEYKNEPETANSPLEEGKEPDTTTVFISVNNKIWKVHTGEISIGKGFILKSIAIAAAIKYVSTLPEGCCSRILIQGNLGIYRTYWVLGEDEYPPQKKPTGGVKMYEFKN